MPNSEPNENTAKASTLNFLRALTLTSLLACLASAQQATAPASTPAAAPRADVSKAADDAKTAAKNAGTALNNAQQAAGTAQTAANKANDSADAAKNAADAAAKSATAADQSLQSVKKTLNSSTSILRQPRPARKSNHLPIDDYIPCLLDDDEIYQKRTLETWEDRQSAKKDAPLSTAAATNVADAIRQYFVSAAAPPSPVPTPNDKHGQQYSKNLNEYNQTLDTITAQVNSVIYPDLFVGKKLSDVPNIVSGQVQSAQAGHIPAAGNIPAEVVTAGNNNQAIQNVALKIVPDQTSKFVEPDDVVCSFSLMQWHETSDNFGRRVANQYVAIQVTVRNLNNQNEFIVHDIQIAVDTGLNRAQFGKFEAARDKLVVRNVAQRGQTEDRRNLIINTLQAVGAIAGGASTAVTQGLPNASEAQDMSSAVAIFQGPFMTGVTNIFPDHTIEHINHINDLAFSASSTSKTVVPIQGSVPLVTFLSEKPLEQLPFSRCGTSVPRRIWYSAFFYKSPDDSQNPLSPGSSSYLFCQLDRYDDDGNPQPTPPEFNPSPSYYMKPYPYRKWNGAALDVLKRRTFVLVGGVHIKQVASQPTISSISCLPGNDATIDLSKITGPNVTCTLKGENLDLISQVSLQNSLDPNDKTQVQGTSSVSGDTTQASVTFLKADLLKLTGTTYKLYYSLKGSAPQQSSLALTIKQVVSLSPSSLDFGDQAQGSTSTAKTIILTNNGSTAVTITPPVKTSGNDYNDFVPTTTCATVAPGASCTINVTFKPTGTGTRSATLTITDDGVGSPHTVDLTGTGK